MNKSLHVCLEKDLIEMIDRMCGQKLLKRSTVAKLYLSQALSKLKEKNKIDLQNYLVFDKKLSNLVISISLQISEEDNKELNRLCDYIPISKKKLAEMLITQELREFRENQKKPDKGLKAAT